MKIIVATKRGQGGRKNDFMHATAGEPVYVGFECDGESVDGRCGCRRGWTGFRSAKGTTTAIIAERPWTAQEYRAKVRRALGKHLAMGDGLDDQEELDGITDETVKELTRLADSGWVGLILERRGTSIKERRLSA